MYVYACIFACICKSGRHRRASLCSRAWWLLELLCNFVENSEPGLQLHGKSGRFRSDLEIIIEVSRNADLFWGEGKAIWLGILNRKNPLSGRHRWLFPNVFIGWGTCPTSSPSFSKGCPSC
jgi:hypothetical protein